MRRAVTTACLTVFVTLAGYAGAHDRFTLSVTPFAEADDRTLLRTAAQAFENGDSQTAIMGFSDATPCNPTDAGPQILLARAYQASASGNPELPEMAAAGYDLAQSPGQDAFWASALPERVAFGQGRYAEAEAAFARAILRRPDDGRAPLTPSMSAYRAGDTDLATASVEQALRTPQASSLWPKATRMASLSRAAAGDAPGAQAYTQKLQIRLPRGDAATSLRVDQLIRTSAADDIAWNADVSEAPIALEQISVDVAIALSQTTQAAAPHEAVVRVADSALTLQFSADPFFRPWAFEYQPHGQIYAANFSGVRAAWSIGTLS